MKIVFKRLTPKSHYHVQVNGELLCGEKIYNLEDSIYTIVNINQTEQVLCEECYRIGKLIHEL